MSAGLLLSSSMLRLSRVNWPLRLLRTSRQFHHELISSRAMPKVRTRIAASADPHSARAEHRRRAEPVDDDEEHGREEDAEEGHAQHAAEHGGAQRAAHLGPRPAADQQREDAQDEGEGGHHDGPQAELAGVQGRLAPRLAALAAVLGELHDQDRVLAGQPHQDHEADLREDVDVHLGVGGADAVGIRCPARRRPGRAGRRSSGGPPARRSRPRPR